MDEPTQQRFNLVFSGQLLPDTNPERARRTLAGFFGLRDPAAVKAFFSGKPVALRRNLSRDDAQRLYRQLRAVGLICEISALDFPGGARATRKDAKPVSQKAAPRKPAARKKASQTGSLPVTIKTSPSAAVPAAADRPEPEAPPGSRPAPAPADKPSISADKPPPGKLLGVAPNLFALRPAQLSRSRDQIVETLQIRAIVSAAGALALCVLILAVALRFPAAPAGSEPRGPLALASLPGNELIILLDSALLLHERSGLPRERIAARDLGFDQLAPPLLALADGRLLVNGRSEGSPLRLQRCELASRQCEGFPSQRTDATVIAVASSFLNDSFFLLNADGILIRSNAEGTIEAEAAAPLPRGNPRLLASDGLLLLPANDGPLLGIYRPDRQNFGQQLDALLLMPAAAVTAGQNQIRDIALGTESRWAILEGEDAAPGLYRFNPQWGNPVAVSIPPGYRNPYLQSWRDKILFADPGQATIARLAATGEPEAPFESALLQQEHDDWIETIRQRQLLRHLGLGLPLVLVLFCVLGAALYLGAVRAIRHIPDRRSALLDPMPAGINWLPATAARNTSVARLGVYLLCLLLLPLLAFLLSGNWRAALALLPALGGWLYAWGALRRGTGGHLGFLESRFVAVDYDGRYFYGEKSLLRGTGNFLLAPGVVLPISFAGIRNIGLPRSNARGPLLPPAQRSSWIEVLGSLWLYRHPWMDALLALCAGTVISAAALLLVQS